MKLHLSGDISTVIDGASLIAEDLQIELSNDGYPIHVSKREGSLIVENRNGQGKIQFEKTVHFFRALGLWVEQKQKLDEFEITEEEQFTMSGAMLDVSRNAVATVKETKDYLRKMAIMGLNTLMLYTEDTYEVKEYPYFGYMRGRYTEEELQECDQSAIKLGIEMIPCIQTLAHLREAIKWNYANSFKDTDDILFVDKPETYEFIEHCIKAASKPFKTKRIHIGMDEAFQLGLGKYIREKGYKDHIELMNIHLQKVVAITEKLGLKPMIWSDMYFSLFEDKAEYRDESGNIKEDIITSIPDVQLVYWNYYSKDQEHYETTIKNHRLLGKEPIFAGGAWTWNGLAPNYGKALVTSEASIAACKKAGIKEVFVTMWGDNGAETPLKTSLPMLQLFAEHTYHEKVTLEQVSERFAFCADGHFDDFMILKELDETPGVMKDNFYTSMTSKVLLYQDILIGLYDDNIRGLGLGKYYENLIGKLHAAKKNNPTWYPLFDFYEQLAVVLSDKAEAGLDIKELYDRKDHQGMQEMMGRLVKIKNNVDQLRQRHRDLWFAANKAFGFEVIDIRYSGVIGRIDSVIYRLQKWLDGKLDRIEELEEIRLRHDGPWEIVDGVIGGNVYHRIVTAGNFSL